MAMCVRPSTPNSPNFVPVAFTPLLGRVSCEQTALAPSRVNPGAPGSAASVSQPSVRAALGISGCVSWQGTLLPVTHPEWGG